MAQYSEVRAPSSVECMRSFISGLIGHGTERQMSDAITPGCREYVVTPSPSRRRESSWACRTLTSFDTEYS